MRISVVIATYNRPALLLSLLGDLAHQLDAGDFDVTVVDDGSTPAVRPQLEARKWPFPLQVIEQSNTGQARARHNGIVASHGEIVVIVDDDMQLPVGFLAHHKRLHEQGADVVLGQLKPADDLAHKPLFERFHAEQLALFVQGIRDGKPIPGSALCTGNVSLRRAHYLEIGGFDASLERSEDRDLGIRLEKAGARFAFSEDAYTKHGSDHTDRAKWLLRAYLYGVYDRRISRKHPDDLDCDPWHYLELVHPVSRPLLLAAVMSESFGTRLSRVVLAVSESLDRRGLERPALKGATLAFGLEYFRGLRSEHGTTIAALDDLRRYVSARMQSNRLHARVT